MPGSRSRGDVVRGILQVVAALGAILASLATHDEALLRIGVLIGLWSPGGGGV